MATPDDAPPPWTADPPPSAWRRVGFLLAGVLVIGMLALATLLWGLRNESATAWLLQWVPGVHVVEPRGALLGDFSARRADIELSGGNRLLITNLRWRGLALDHEAGVRPFLQFRLAALAADRVELLSAPGGNSPAAAPRQAPTSLRLPFAFDVRSLRIGEFHASALGDKPLRELHARVRLSADNGSHHRIDDLSLAWDRLQAQGSLQIGTSAPLELDVRLQAQQAEQSVGTAAGAAAGTAVASSGSTWAAVITAKGPLERPTVKATLRVAPRLATAAGGAQTPGDVANAANAATTTTTANVASLDVDASLLPFAAWPIAELSAHAQALDLSLLASALPVTRLTGTATAQNSAAGRTVGVALDLRNDVPGRWNEGRLPLRSARFELRGDPADLDSVELPALALQLGSATEPAGDIQGSGRWGKQGWTLQTALTDLRPARLDAGLPEMRLSGPLALDGHGFVAAQGAAPTRPEVELHAELAGELLGAARPAAASARISLLLDARGNAGDLEVRRFRATAGAASVEGRGHALRGADDSWQLSGRAALKDFDPAPWLGSAADSPWRRALHRLNADAAWDVVLPAAARVAGLRGSATLNVADSVLAGVPLTATATLHKSDAGAALQAALRIDAVGNRLRLDGQLDERPDASASEDRWTVDGSADAPALARLAPVLRLAGIDAAGAFGSQIGTLNARAHASGRAPRLSTVGSNGWLVDDIEVRQLKALAAGASAEGHGRAQRSGSAWQLSGQAALKNFDPAAWLPVSADTPWRQGPTRLNADAKWQVAVPTAERVASARPAPPQSVPTQPTPGQPPAVDLPGWLAALRGSAALTLAGSQLAGVPLSGSASLHSADAAATLQAALDAAGNRLTLDANVDPRGAGRNDRWDVSAELPLLARLAPLLRLSGIAGIGTDLSGALSADAHVSGRWPQLSSHGRASAEQLRSAAAGGVGVAHGALRWQFGSAADAAAALNLELTQTRIGKLQIDSLRGVLQGSTKAHTLDLRADARGGPPAWTEAVHAVNAAPAQAASSAAAKPPAAVSPPEHTLLSLRAQGGLDIGAAPRWRGTLQQLELSRGLPGSAPWAALRGVDIDAQLAADATPAHASISAGRAQLLGATVRWDHIAWQAASAAGPAQIDLHADIDPLPVAPLLSRLQPEFGWGGDLRMGGSVSLRSAPQFSADVVVQRQSGDLSVNEEGLTQSLGLTDLRLALNADDGLWSFTAALAGSHVGVGAAAVTVRTSPQRLWPPADAPITGVLEARVADLGSWGAWVPTGWRLSGRVDTSASISGRFGAPELTGIMNGSGLGARNVVEGVNVSDGQLKVTLQGKTARIERLQLRGGSGTVDLEGGVDLGSGAAPLRADLRLVAEHFQLLGRVDRRIVTSGSGRLLVDGNRLNVDGRFTVDEGLIDFTRSDAPSLSDDVVVTRSAAQSNPNAPVSTPAGAQAYAVALDLTVGLGQQLRLRGRGIDTELRGELKITAPDGQLAINGSVNTVNGTYAAYNQKLKIDRGVITFSGPVANPRLDIQATRDDLDVSVGVAISGYAVNPRIRLFSDPDMSDLDKLSYLMLGHASDSLGGSDVALLQQAALALLSGEGQSPTTSFTKALGLDSLSLSQGQSGDLRDTVVSLGKQISRRWYVGYEQGLNATAGSFQLIYRLARRFTLRAQSGGDSSIDVIWTWRWQ